MTSVMATTFVADDHQDDAEPKSDGGEFGSSVRNPRPRRRSRSRHATFRNIFRQNQLRQGE